MLQFQDVLPKYKIEFWCELKELRNYNGRLYLCPPQKYGNSRPEVFCEKGVLRNFGKIHRKISVAESLFNKVAGLRPSRLKTLAQVLSSEFCEISKNTYS